MRHILPTIPQITPGKYRDTSVHDHDTSVHDHDRSTSILNNILDSRESQGLCFPIFLLNLWDHSYETVLKRWPVILTGVIDRLHRINHELTVEVQNGDTIFKNDLEEKISEGKDIISRISGLKYRMGGNKKLE